MSILAPLRSKPIALIWSGLALGAIGDQLYAVALVWMAVALMGAGAGYLSALQAGATLAAALFGGIWADSWDHRRTMIAADLLRAAIILAFVALASIAPLSVAMLIQTALGVAALQAFFRPALQAILPRLAGDPRQLPATNALFDATERIARLSGPLIVGALSGIVPVIHFFTLDAVTFLGSAAAVATVGRALPRRRPRASAETARMLSRIGAGIRRGAAAVRAQPLIAYGIGSGGVLNGLWYVVMFLAVPLVIARRGLAIGAGSGSLGAYAAVMASYGAVNLATNLVVGNRPLPHRPARLIFSGNAVLGLGLALMGAAMALLPERWLLPALMAAAGLAAAGGPMQDIPFATLRQTLFAPGDIAAVMRLYMVATQSGLLLGMVAAPPLLTAFGPAAVVLACGGGIIMIGAIGLARFGPTALSPACAPSPILVPDQSRRL